jgi:WD40 repeat protein
VVHRIAFSRDGRTLASASEDGTVKLWETATGHEIRMFRGHTRSVTGVAFHPDSHALATSSEDWSLRLWDATSGREIRIFRGHSGPIADVAFSPDGRSLASAGGEVDHPQRAGDIKNWDVLGREGVRDLGGHASFPKGVAFSPDGKSLASASHDQTVRIWDAVSGQEQRILRGHTPDDFSVLQVNSVAFHPEGKYLASAGGNFLDKRGEVLIWDIPTGREVVSIPGHPTEVASVTFSPDGRLLAASYWDQSIKLWDVATWKEARTLYSEGEPKPFFGTISELCVGNGRVAFSPNSRWLAAPGYGWSVMVWEAATGRGLNRLVGHTARVLSVHFSPDGRLLASAGEDRTIKIWDATTGREMHTLAGHGGLVSRVHFSPDGKRLVSASFDRTIRIWDPILGLELLTLPAHTLPVRDVGFSPDGRRIASAAGEASRPGDVPGELRIWEGETVFPEPGR